MGVDQSALQKFLRDILIALAAAATIAVVGQGNATILGTLQLGWFEVTFLWSLCAVLVVTRLALPALGNWWRWRNLDWEDFKNLENDARAVREHYQRRNFSETAEVQVRHHATEQSHDLMVHLELLGVRFPTADPDVDLYDALARLIKLMQRGDLKTARKLYPPKNV